MTALDDRDIAVTKRCRKCNEEKPVSVFYKNGRSADGYGYYCKKCDSNKRAQNYFEGKTGVTVQNRADRFMAGLVEPSELTHEELVGGFIYLDDGSKYESKNFNHRTKGKFTAELSKRLNRMIKDKSVRSLEVIFEIIDSDLVEPADRLKAATWWAERVIGKTPEKLELSLDNAPYEEIFENINGGSRSEHRKAIGAPTIDAEIVEDSESDISLSTTEDSNNIIEVVVETDLSGSEDSTGLDNIGSRDDQISSRSSSTDGISSGIQLRSTEEIADSTVANQTEAKALKKRIADAKRKRFAARAVGAPLANLPWLIDWRVRQDGLQACLVPPSAITEAKLDVIRANDEATDDVAFIAQQRANQLMTEANKAKNRVEKLRSKAAK